LLISTGSAHRGRRGRRPGRGGAVRAGPEDFTVARNLAAKAAKDASDPRTADAIKALRKPTLAAWLANQLVRADPDSVHQLTELGEQLRQADLSADDPALRRLSSYRSGPGRWVGPSP
jgi:hypothetical protein